MYQCRSKPPAKMGRRKKKKKYKEKKMYFSLFWQLPAVWLVLRCFAFVLRLALGFVSFFFLLFNSGMFLLLFPSRTRDEKTKRRSFIMFCLAVWPPHFPFLPHTDWRERKREREKERERERERERGGRGEAESLSRLPSVWDRSKVWSYLFFTIPPVLE